MAFKVADLPGPVQKIFADKHLDFNVLYWAAREHGISDTNKLTDILFYKAHPELVTPLFPWIGTPISPSMANYNQLKSDWTKWQQFCKSLSHGTTTKKKKANPKEDRSDELFLHFVDRINVNQIPFHDNFSRATFRAEYVTFKEILIRYIEGVTVDDRYWLYQPTTVLDENAKQNPQWLRPLGYKEAFVQIRKKFEDTGDENATKSEAQRVFNELQYHLDWLFKWHEVAGKSGDSSIRDYTEYRNLVGILKRSVGTNPFSVYYCVSHRLTQEFSHLVRLFPPRLPLRSWKVDEDVWH